MDFKSFINSITSTNRKHIAFLGAYIYAVFTQLIRLLNEVSTINSLILQRRKGGIEILSNFSKILQ